jgi:hypothetical protein
MILFNYEFFTKSWKVDFSFYLGVWLELQDKGHLGHLKQKKVSELRKASMAVNIRGLDFSDTSDTSDTEKVLTQII